MKATSQHEFHPVAERLNAFAEQALGQGERDEVLQHLALCGRCRQVVALAQKAEQAEAQVAAPARVRAAMQPNAWWKQWRVVWVPTAVVAAFAVTSISLYLRQVEKRETAVSIAKLTPAQGTEPASAPASGEKSEAAPPALSAPASPAAKTAKAGNPGAAPRERLREGPVIARRFQPLPAPAPPPVNLASGFAGEGFLRGGSPAIYQSSGAVQRQAEKKQQDLAKQQAEANAPFGRLFAAKAAPPAALHGANMAPLAATESVAVTPAAPELETRTASEASLETLKRAPAAMPFAVRMAGTVHLPSGLPVISIASAGKVILAIDRAGALFISQDRGSTWNQVLEQWAGRAVLVRRQPAEPAAAGAPPEAEQAAPQAAEASEVSPSATIFEIVNDKSKVWLSTDGRIWTPK